MKLTKQQQYDILWKERKVLVGEDDKSVWVFPPVTIRNYVTKYKHLMSELEQDRIKEMLTKEIKKEWNRGTPYRALSTNTEKLGKY